MGEYWTWHEDIEPYYQEIFLAKNGLDASWADIVSFPVNEYGYNVLNDLIETLKQMRDHIQDINEPICKSDNMGNVQSGNKRIIYPPRLAAPKIKSRNKRKVGIRSGY